MCKCKLAVNHIVVARMRNVTVSRRNPVPAHRKVPLNSIILPPLSPSFPEDQPHLIGKLSVNKTKTGSVSNDIVIPRQNQDISQRNTESSKESQASRVAQLEQNIKFLQEQHQLMLNGLHNEIESLKVRNRELQFQLIFANKTSTPVSSPSSSSEDDAAKHKVYTSPQPLNETSLQVEILEKELGELKLQIQEAEKRNVSLVALIDEQKRRLDRYECNGGGDRGGNCDHQQEPDLVRRLDDAEALIRRLRRENSDMKREYYNGGSGRERVENGYHHHQGGRGSGRGNGGQARHRGNNGSGGGHATNGHFRSNWFPPVHTQSYWQQGGGLNSRSPNGNGGGSGGSGGASDECDKARAVPGTLPALSGGNGGGGRRASNNNHHHHYYSGGGKYHKGGGGGPQKKHT